MTTTSVIQPLEPIETINKRLLDFFGKFDTGEANWKLVWSEDMTEKRLMEYTDSGILLLTPEVREVKKFGYIHNRYVLCQLVPVPEMNRPELVDMKVSYEPIWTFEDNFGNPTPPKWEIMLIVINNIFDSLSKRGHTAPYKMPETEHNTTEGMKYRADKLYEAMFGNETKLGDALGLDTAVGYGTRQRKDWLH